MRSLVVRLSVCICLLACGRPPRTAPAPSAHALSGLAAQHIAVLPTYAVRVMPGLTWANAIGPASALQRALDTDIRAALEERRVRTWVFPEELQQAYRRNASYAADPGTLAEEPLRSPTLAVDTRLPEPLASQVRTLVALQDGVRLVLAPVELRFEPAGAGRGRAVLRVALLDARLSTVRWLGTIPSDTADAFGPVITASVASALANVVAIP